MIKLWPRFEIQQLLTSEKRLMMRSECLRRIRNARQQRFLYVSNVLLSCKEIFAINTSKGSLSAKYTSPPMTHTKSGVRTNGAHSLLKPCAMMKGERGGGREERSEREGGGEGQGVVG